MNTVNDLTNQTAAQAEPEPSPVAVEVPERPALATNIHLSGELQAGGFKDQQWFIQRDGQFLQLPELLYRVAEQLNGERTLEEIAERVTEATEWLVSAEQVRYMLQTKLIPAGVVALDAAASSVVPHGGAQTRQPFGFKSVKLLGPRAIDPVTRVLQYLYKPPLFMAFLILIALAHVWLYLVHGVTSTIHDALYSSGQLLIIFLLMLLASIFHEFGHASALRYSGGKVRGMGAGLYLLYPMFYTDVTDSYRLDRLARLRTDIGGFYFMLIFAAGAAALYFLTHQEWLLSVLVLTDLAILAECSPLVRFDGYWVIADLLGIPDLFSSLFSQARPFLRSIFSLTGPLRHHLSSLPALVESQLPNLKPWVRVAFVCYLIAAIFGLPLLVVSLLIREPSIVAYTWGALVEQRSAFVEAQSSRELAGMVLALLQAVLITLSLCGGLYVLYLMGRRLLRGVWKWSKGSLKQRIAAALLIVGFLVLVAYFWAPQLQVIAK